MKEIFKDLGAFLLEVLIALNWQKVLYEAFSTVVYPKLEEKAASTESKIDDVMVEGLKALVEKFIKPEGKSGVTPTADGKASS